MKKIIIVLLFIFILSTFSSGQGTWANVDYPYNREFNIWSGNSSTYLNIPVRLIINTSSIIAAGKMQAKCQDILFANSTGHYLSFYIRNDSCNTATSEIFVKIPYLANSYNVSIYMYYGNSSALTLSSGDNTFLQFDDFLGTSINSSKWNSGGVAGVANGLLNLNGASGATFKAGTIITAPYMLEIKASYCTTYCSYGSRQDTTYDANNANLGNYFKIQDVNGRRWSLGNTEIGTSGAHARDGEQHTFSLYNLAKSVEVNFGFENQGLITGAEKLSTTANLDAKYIAVSSWAASNYYLDWVRAYPLIQGSQQYVLLSGENNITFATYNISFNNQLPSDITPYNIFGSFVNISYNYSFTGGTNISNSKLFYFINSSVCEFWGNNSCLLSGNSSIFNKFNNNVSYIEINDNEVYPANYIYPNQTLMQQSYKISRSIGNNDRYRFTMNNITLDNNMILEIMLNCSLTNSASLWTYNNNNLSAQCATISSMSYNHSHGVNSSHIVITLPTNKTGNLLCNIPFTSGMRFEIRGNVGSSCNIYTSDLISNPNTMEYSSNNGNTFNYQNYTVDSHLHHINGDEKFCYFSNGQSNINSSIIVNSSLRCDLLQLGGEQPSQTIIYTILSQSYPLGNYIVLNYSKCTSPSNINISTYTINAYDENLYLLQTLYIGTNLFYNWNTQTSGAGNYILGSKCSDINGVSSSEAFTSLFSLNITGVGAGTTIINNYATNNYYTAGNNLTINPQTVKINDYYKLAITYLNTSSNQNMPCYDCLVNYTIYNSDGIVIINNKPMSLLYNNVYGFLINPQVLDIDKYGVIITVSIP